MKNADRFSHENRDSFAKYGSFEIINIRYYHSAASTYPLHSGIWQSKIRPDWQTGTGRNEGDNFLLRFLQGKNLGDYSVQATEL
jgi:hypothetical protein